MKTLSKQQIDGFNRLASQFEDDLAIMNEDFDQHPRELQNAISKFEEAVMWLRRAVQISATYQNLSS